MLCSNQWEQALWKSFSPCIIRERDLHFLSTQWSEATTGWHCNLEWVLFIFFRIQLNFLSCKVKQYQQVLTSLVICFLESLSTETPMSAMRKVMCFFLWVSSITSVREADALFAAWKFKTKNHQQESFFWYPRHMKMMVNICNATLMTYI